MDFTITQILMYLAVPLVTALLTHIVRGLMQRIEYLEEKSRTQVNESEVRQILEDKLNPITEDIKFIRDKLEKVTDFLITRNKD